MLRTAHLAVLTAALSFASGRASAASNEQGHASPRAIREYVRARLAEAAGDQGAAIDALRLALSHDPESPQLRISYAEALARGGRLPAAEAEARRAVQLSGDGAAGVDAHRVLGKVLLARGRIPPAEEALLRATTLEADRVRRAQAAASRDPDAAALDPEPWRVLAEARLRRGDPPAAVLAGEDLAKLEPALGAGILREVASRLLEGNDPVAAERVARRATEISRSDGAAWKLLSRAQEERGDVAGARRSIEQALIADPGDPETLLAAGQLSLRQGDLSRARAWFEQLLLVAPDEKTAQLRVAASWLESKRPTEALAVVPAGDEPQVLYLRAIALSRLRRWAETVSVLERMGGAANDEIQAAACALRGSALSRLGRSDDAIRVLREAVGRAPRDPTLLFALGEAYDRAGQREAALAQMRAVLQVNPDHAESMNYIGYAYAEGNERLDEAEALLARALRAEPDNAYYLDSFGWILYKRRDLGRAVEALERAATLAPELTILDHLGDAYRAAQRPADAAGAYQRALQTNDPDDDEPGLTAAARRTLLQEKLEQLGGAHDGRAANLRR